MAWSPPAGVSAARVKLVLRPLAVLKEVFYSEASKPSPNPQIDHGNVHPRVVDCEIPEHHAVVRSVVHLHVAVFLDSGEIMNPELGDILVPIGLQFEGEEACVVHPDLARLLGPVPGKHA